MISVWHRLMDWFGEVRERYQLVRHFNNSAKHTFIAGQFPVLLEARITRGSPDYRHEFSRFMAGGFRIKAMSGRALNKSEIIEIGNVILDNEELVRKLVALGWDTLEIHDDTGYQGYKWPLKKYVKMGGFLGQSNNW